MKKIAFLTALLLVAVSNHLFARISVKEDSIAVVNFRMADSTLYDSVAITFWPDYFPGSTLFPPNINMGWNSSNSLTIHPFLIPDIEKPGYMRVRIYGQNQRKEHYDFLIEPGDRVAIAIMRDSLLFSGLGSAKLDCTYKVELLRRQLRDNAERRAITRNERRKEKSTFWGDLNEFIQEPLDSILIAKLAPLENAKLHMGPRAYSIIKANIIGEDYFRRLYKFAADYDYGMIVDPTKKELYEKIYNEHFASLPDFALSDDAKILSNWYIKYLDEKMRFDRKLKYNFPPDQVAAQSYIISNFDGELRDKYLTNFILTNYRPGEHHDSLFKASFTIVKTPYCLKILDRLKINLTLNVPAFAFELKDIDGKIVRLDDFKGKVVFLDFWFTGCKYCIEYYRDVLSEVEKHFLGDQDVAFLSVSIDANKEQWLKSVKSERYTGKEAINLYTGGAQSNHPLIRYYDVKSYPHQIVIDKAGRNFKLSGIQNLGTGQLISMIEDALYRKP